MARSLGRLGVFGCAAVLLSVTAWAGAPKSLVVNGGFEDVAAVAGVAKAGGRQGSWTIKGGPDAPARWTRSAYFGGELAILAEQAPEGERFVRVRAGDEREAQLYQACPAIRAGRYYRVSLRYRGGPVAVKTYEYGAKPGAPHIETVVAGQAAPLNGPWRRIEGFYAPEGPVKFSVVASVAAGCVADLDDLRVWRIQFDPPAHNGAWLDARQCGASGSTFETTASTKAGSNRVVVADAGDFRPGQGVMISKCRPHYTNGLLRGPASYYRAPKPLEGVAELRGFDGSAGDWRVFILDIDGDKPLSFRWSDDLGRTWPGRRVPITWDWQTLSGGQQVRFLKRDLKLGHGVTFSARTQLVTTIERVEGDVLWLRDAPTKSVTDAAVRHCDSAALQLTIDRAVRERRHVYIPNGHYRLARGLDVRRAAIRIEGASSVHTVLDISDGEGAVFALYGGQEVTLRHMRLVGHTGYDQMAGVMRNATGNPFWCCALKLCRAVTIRGGTARVLCENVHATRMSAEAFYCQGPRRTGRGSPRAYTKSLTFLRCSVVDSASNAFNNNDMSENTCVLYCRIERAAPGGWHAYEGPARFIKLVGNYVRDAGPFTVGDCSSRPDYLYELGCGQAIVAHNVFEGSDGRNGGVHLGHGPTQVTVANNLFVNFNGPAIRVSGHCARLPDRASFPARNVVVTGNIIDLTYPGAKPRSRCGVDVSASDVTVADNQIYVRGDGPTRTCGIRLAEPACNLNVHDNLIRNCARGLHAVRTRSAVRQVVGPDSFLDTRLPLVWAWSHCYRGWDLLWTSGVNKGQIARLEGFDPKTLVFKLAKAHDMKVGDHFEVIPAGGANWSIHDNTVTGCTRPVVLDAYGSRTTCLKNNTVTRGGARRVDQAVALGGLVTLTGNLIFGFDEPGSAALLLAADPAGRERRPTFLRNIVQQCSAVVKESKQGLWAAAVKHGNLFIDCAQAPEAAGEARAEEGITAVVVAPPGKPELRAPRLSKPVTVDGEVAEWPWNVKSRVATMERSPAGDPVSSPSGRLCAAFDDANLYLAMRFDLPEKAKLRAVAGFDRGDGVEVSLRNADPRHPTPIFLLWGSVGGVHLGSTAMGASASQAETLCKATGYAARRTRAGWACEWRIPLAAMGLKAAETRTLCFNAGLSCTATGTWLVWAPTGGRVCDVDQAGELRLAP